MSRSRTRRESRHRSHAAPPERGTAATPSPWRSFAGREPLWQWLEANHNTARELWVRIWKQHTERASVTWQDCVVVAIAWGWIDGQRRALDESSFLQRLTPRRPRSNWSVRNREHAQRLLAEGAMQPAGLAHVEAAKADGRWDAAYAGSADMVLPDDFLQALREVPAAATAFADLDRASLFAIYRVLQTARRADTRARRIASTVAALAAGQMPASTRRRRS